MAEENQVLIMNGLKRKLSPNVQGNDFQKKKTLITDSGTFSSSVSASSLIERFLTEEQSKGKLNISNQHFHLHWWQREILLFQFLELTVQIIISKLNGENPLEQCLEDIKNFGLNILGLPEGQENSYTTIVTSALQVSKDREIHAGDKDGVVKVEPKPEKGLISGFIDFLVKIIVTCLYHPNYPTSKFLTEEGFAPIREETSPTSDLKVRGEIPKDLNGTMFRNGPDPPSDPVAHYAWMDGDGMFHAIRFKEGKPTYVSRYVQTSRYKQEQFFNEAQFLKYGDLDGPFGLLMSCVQLLKVELGVLDVSYGWLNGDVGLIYHDGMLMALQDFDKPYVINILQDGDLETRGINDYNKRLTHSFLPHPKKDPITGELFIMGVSYTPPYAIYNIVTKQGSMGNPVPITMSGPSYMHDLGITKNYVIFMDLPYCYDPENMVKNEDWIYMFDINKKSRFGILPKYAKDEEKIKWFEFDEPFFIFHNGNSWEEDDDTIVLISCLMKPQDTPKSLMGHEVLKQTKLFFRPPHVFNGPSHRMFNPAQVSTGTSSRHIFNPAHVFNGPSHQGVQTYMSSDQQKVTVDFTLPTLYKFTFNMKTGEATKIELSKTYCDYPKINESYMGRRCQYLYTSEFNSDARMFSVVKTNLQLNTELKLYLGEFNYGSEVSFVPRQFDTQSAEDDGYLTTFVHDEEKGVSFVYVIDAQNMKLEATIELPNKVPYGFHATFVTEEELQAGKQI